MAKCKRELRKARLVILAEIDRLDKLRCKFCHLDSGYSPVEKSRCKCDSAVRVRKLGIQLNKLTRERKPDESIPKIDTMPESFEGLTIELYKKMKAAKMTDRDVVKRFRVGSRRLVEWKKVNGLSKKAKEGVTC